MRVSVQALLVAVPSVAGFAAVHRVVVVLFSLLFCLAPVAPAEGGYSRPQSVTPSTVPASAADQATDQQGDTAFAFVSDGQFKLLIRKADGTVLPVRTVASIDQVWSVNQVAVDRDGDGVVIWDQLPDIGGGYLYARRFSRTGRMSPVRQVSPNAHWVNGAEVGVRPGGSAVITWARITDAGYRPYLRTLGSGNLLGPVRTVGKGPNVDPPLVLVEDSGRTTLVWTNETLLARRVAADGTLGPLHVIRRQAFEGEQLIPDDVGVDRRGVITAACTRWTRNTAIPPNQNSRKLACLLRISPRLRLMGRVRNLTDKRTAIDGVGIGVSPSGTAVVGWQKNFYEGAVVQRVSPAGRLGPKIAVASGGLADIALTGNGDGVVTSTGIAPDGDHRIIRATRVVDGHLHRTERIGINASNVEYLRAATLPRGRVLVAWNAAGTPPGIQVVKGW